MYTTIIVSILGSAGVFAFIEFLIQRRDNRNSLLTAIKKELDELKSNMLRDRATDARRRILMASDETLQGTLHSREWWEQIMEDITEYEKYCATHQGYENNKAKIAIKELTECYETRRERHDFLA